MKSNLLILFLLAIALTSCGNGEDALKEQTNIQTQEAIKADNENREMWSARLAGDLSKRRSFISAIEGEFEGQFLVKESSYMIRLMITSTIPDYEINRTRTIAELEYELQNLNLNIQIMQWNPEAQRSAVGCVLENVKPDFKKGILNLISENCSNTYRMFLSNNDDEVNIKAESQNIANSIRDGKIDFVRSFKGILRSSTNAEIYNFSLSRN